MHDSGLDIFEEDTPYPKPTVRVILARIAAIIALTLSVPACTYAMTTLCVNTVGSIPEAIVENTKSDIAAQPQDGMVEVLIHEANSYDAQDVLVVKKDGMTFYYVDSEVYDHRSS
jgi:hypothetical protein